MTLSMHPVGLSRNNVRLLFVARRLAIADQYNRNNSLSLRMHARDARTALEERIRTELIAGARTRRFGE